MISERVIGVYASVGTLTPGEQAAWYRRLAEEHGVRTFEIPLFAGRPLAPELVETFVSLKASLVVTLVAQWAGAGQKYPAYGLASPDEAARGTALLDACAILQQCAALSAQGVVIRNVVVHTGQKLKDPLAHGIAMYRSLTELRSLLAATLPATRLAVEPCDTRPLDHPIAFAASKKSSLGLPALLEVLEAVNQAPSAGLPVGLMLNWGRLLSNGDVPLESVQRVLGSAVPLAGVILSGAGSSPDGFRDAHNSHLDPASGFTASDAQACARALQASSQPAFLGMKCSRATVNGELTVEQILVAQAALLKEISVG